MSAEKKVKEGQKQLNLAKRQLKDKDKEIAKLK